MSLGELNLPEIHAHMDSLRGRVGASASLVAYAVASIQRVIFGMTRQAGIREASASLLEFDAGIWKDRATLGTVFSGGGRGLFLVARGTERDLKAEIEKRFATLPDDATINFVEVPYSPGPEGEAASLHWLWRVAATRKDEGRPSRIKLPSKSGDELCISCHRRDGVLPAKSNYVPGAGEREMICHACRTLFERDRKRRERANNDLGELTACLSADGNNMGQLVEDITSFEALAAMSIGLRELFLESVSQATSRIGEDRIIAPVTGGDDVRAFLHPSDLDDFVSTLVTSVEAGMKRLIQAVEKAAVRGMPLERLRRFGLGVGIVIAPRTYPAMRRLEYAEEWQTSAKQYCRKTGVRSAADLLILVTGDELADQKRCASLHAPVVIDDRASNNWAKMISAARALAAVPTNQRATVRAARRDLATEDAVFENLFLYQVARSEKWQQYLDACEVDWRDTDVVRRAVRGSHLLSDRMFALADILAGSQRKAEARP